MTDVTVAFSGRIQFLRSASNKLQFYTVRADGVTVQVMMNYALFEDKAEYEHLRDNLKRGDIVGFRGHPGKSKRGELSLMPQSGQLLSPCLHMLPKVRSSLACCRCCFIGVLLLFVVVVCCCCCLLLFVVVCCCLLLFVVVLSACCCCCCCCCCCLLFVVVVVGVVVGCWLLVVGCWLLVVGCCCCCRPSRLHRPLCTHRSKA